MRTTEWHGATEYDVVRVRAGWWYFSDDFGRRFYGPRPVARFLAKRRNRDA